MRTLNLEEIRPCNLDPVRAWAVCWALRKLLRLSFDRIGFQAKCKQKEMWVSHSGMALHAQHRSFITTSGFDQRGHAYGRIVIARPTVPI